MPKKSSSSKQAKDTKLKDVAASVTEEKNPSPAVKKPCNEIDAIFSGKKRKLKSENTAGEATDRPSKDLKTKSKLKKKKSITLQEGAFGGAPSRPRKRTEDGLVVYTEEELGIGKGDAGGTPLCPFDCSCCF